MQYAQIGLGFDNQPMPNLPLLLMFTSNGCIGLRPAGGFKPTMEDGDGVLASFFEDAFLISENELSETYSYGHLYPADMCPLLVKWVKAQHIHNPFVKE